MQVNLLQESIEKLPAILSIRETANFLSVRRLKVYNMIRENQLPAWKDDEGSWCIARADLKKYCFQNTNL